MQAIIQSLASEGGLARIREMVDLPIDDMSEARVGATYASYILPFFQTITHPEVLASAILERHLATIYNYLYGPGGQRASPLFEPLSRMFMSLTDGEISDGVVESLQPNPGLALECAVTALVKLIDVNGSASLVEAFGPILEVFCVVTDDARESIWKDYHLAGIRKQLERAQQRFGVGQGIPTTERVQPRSAALPSFELNRDAPGWLSSNGARHDNDSDDIRKISILPTSDEIRSQFEEYRPLADPTQLHLPGIEGLLDRHFRLLREDTIGPLRDAIRHELDTSTRSGEVSKAVIKGARTHYYRNLEFSDIDFDQTRSLRALVFFDQPAPSSKRTQKERSEWWRASKRLQPESLVCVLTPSGSALFCIVVDPAEPAYGGTKFSEQKATDPIAETLEQRAANYRKDSDGTNRAHVVLRLVDHSEENIDHVLGHFRTDEAVESSTLIEFPGVLLPAFQPTLEALQMMFTSLDLPFQHLLAPPLQQIRDTSLHVPPNYATDRTFRFDMGCLTMDNDQVTLSTRDVFDLDDLQQHTTLDDAQASAVFNALTHDIALIQGPPGTGKSFTGVALIRILLANAKKAKLGPIIAVCYTNHALDQLLEHLVDSGIQQIVRIGSRSKSQVLEPLNLRVITASMDMTKLEKERRYELNQQLQSEADNIREILDGLLRPGSDSNLEKYLEVHSPDRHSELFGTDDDGFQRVNYRKDNIIKTWLSESRFRRHEQASGVSHMPARALEALETVHVFHMNRRERQKLYNCWLADMRQILRDRLVSSLATYQKAKDEYDHIKDDLKLRCLNQANIIGITTSGLARNLTLLRKLRSKVLICEEAGEVLEAHLLTALLPSIEHAILIGDHLQLRPQVNNFDLSRENPAGKKYSLDVSLFERLVEPEGGVSGLPFSTLEIQRRMHPSISSLVRRTIYPTLQDFPTVQTYPPVSGVKPRLFWLDHRQPESGAEDSNSTSHTNDFEVEMVASVVSHLVRQSVYDSTDIAVLTPYLGQLFKLRRNLSKRFEIVVSDRDAKDLEDAGLPDELAPQPVHTSRSTLLDALRIATIDNFQGEEAKVVIISLCRSNPQNACGFLRTPNRINVLLSRAKHGMYIIGNALTASSAPMWRQVIEILEEGQNIGPELELDCPRHPDVRMSVSKPDDFLRLAPEVFAALQFATQFFHVRTCAKESALIATSAEKMVWFRPIMDNVYQFAVEITRPAPIAAKIYVTGRIAHRVKLDARSGAFTPNVRNFAASHVRRVRRRYAPRDVNTGLVVCHVRHHATGFLAVSAVRNCWIALINVCATNEILDTDVDFIMGQTYKEIDLDEDPIIFPPCGHFITRSNMDGQMEMAEHYELDADDIPIALKATSVTPSGHDQVTKTCPKCRGSLRSISRYGNIVRKALLNESTRKFIVWANHDYVPLASRLPTEQEKLVENPMRETRTALGTKAESLVLAGSRNNQIREIIRAKNSNRYRTMINLRRAVADHLAKVRVEEQPFRRVFDMVQTARRVHGRGRGKFELDENVLHMTSELRATALLLRCDITLLSDFVKQRPMFIGGEMQVPLTIGLNENRRDCLDFIQVAEKVSDKLRQMEGHFFFASFAAIEQMARPAGATELREAALEHVRLAEAISEGHSETFRSILNELQDVSLAIKEGVFYTPVQSEEWASVVAAMSREFVTTGHWYRCENGHPFTVGECGMPMELARCPECGAPVGGQSHQAAEGVQQVTDLEQQFAEIAIDRDRG
ncbi:MAG: hypothetical protein M1820_003494 [Bogoriella megaspora]|nr:MAG: hypothetical protein M1820_003494 [Bogoriella megaspora]